MLEAKAERKGLCLARVAREELATHLREWSKNAEAPEATICILSEVVGVLFALEVVPSEEESARFSVAIAKLDTATALLPTGLRAALTNVRRQLVNGTSASRESQTLSEASAAEPVCRLSVEVDERSESNFFMGVDGSLTDGGLFIATAELLPAGTKLSLHVRLPTAELEVLGEVAWSREEPSPGMGVRLSGADLSEAEPVLRVMTMREPMDP